MLNNQFQNVKKDVMQLRLSQVDMNNNFNNFIKKKKINIKNTYSILNNINLQNNQIQLLNNSNLKIYINALQRLLSILPLTELSGTQSQLQKLNKLKFSMQNFLNLKSFSKGQLPSQFGELMTLIFFNSPNISKKIIQYLSTTTLSNKGNEKISWLQSSIQCYNKINQYVSDVKINWKPIQGEGFLQNEFLNQTFLNDYQNNYTTTDIYGVLNDNWKTNISTLPISLKKDNQYRLTNSSVSKVYGKDVIYPANKQNIKKIRNQIIQKYKFIKQLSSYKNIILNSLNIIQKPQSPLLFIQQQYNRIVDKNSINSLSQESFIEWVTIVLKINLKYFKKHHLNKLLLKALYTFGKVNDDALNMYKELINSSKIIEKQQMKWSLINCNDKLKKFMIQTTPFKQIYNNDLILVSSSGYIDKKLLIDKLNSNTFDQFVNNININNSKNSIILQVNNIQLLKVSIRQDGVGYKGTYKLELLPLCGLHSLQK